MARFQAGAQPPPVRVWHLADLPALSALRAAAGHGNSPVHGLLGPVEAGRSGILPLGPDMLTTLVLSYAHQLDQPNPLTRASARWGLMWAFWRFGPDMPAVCGCLTDCDCHPIDHNWFFRYTWLMDICVKVVPEDHHTEVPQHPLGIASTADKANDAHAVLSAGYRDWSDTRVLPPCGDFRGRPVVRR